jgi:hypothetical protein
MKRLILPSISKLVQKGLSNSEIFTYVKTKLGPLDQYPGKMTNSTLKTIVNDIIKSSTKKRSVKRPTKKRSVKRSIKKRNVKRSTKK